MGQVQDLLQGFKEITDAYLADVKSIQDAFSTQMGALADSAMENAKQIAAQTSEQLQARTDQYIADIKALNEGGEPVEPPIEPPVEGGGETPIEPPLQGERPEQPRRGGRKY